MEHAIDFNGILSIFYKEDNGKVFYKSLEENEWKKEKEIINNCKKLISVSLVTAEKICIFIESLDNELILYSFIKEQVSKNILIKNIFLYNFIKIVSLNNTLNLFYTKNNKNSCMLYHRTINSDLVISMPFMLDIIDGDIEEPFSLSYRNNEICIGYIKKERMYTIGYRIFNLTKNMWSSFENIENIYGKIDSFEMIREENINFFSYIINNEEDGYLKYGFKVGEVKKSSFIKESAVAIKYCNLFIIDKNLYLSYATSKKIIIDTLSYNNNLSIMSEITIEGEHIINKYPYDCYNNINHIIIIEQDEIYSDISLVWQEKKILEESKSIFSEIQGYDVDIDKLKQNVFEKQQTINKLNTTINELNEKTNIYREEIKKLKIENSASEIEKSRLESSISNLYNEMLERENTLLSLESDMVEYKNTIKKQDDEIKDMTKELINLKKINKDLEDKYNKFIDYDFKKSQDENADLKNQILNLNNEINTLTEMLDNLY